MELKEEIRGIIAGIIEIPIENLPFETEMDNVEGWDSMRNIMILSTLEEKYDIIFPDDDIFDLISVQAFADEIIKLKNV